MATMVETAPPPPPNPNSLVPPTPAAEPPSPAVEPPSPQGPWLWPRRPSIRVTSEFDSDSSIFFHKFSCKLFDSLAKLKLSFNNNNDGEIFDPQLGFISKHLSLHYDLQNHNAFIKGCFDVGSRLHFNASHDVKAQQGEVAMVADLADSGYKFELSSAVPAIGFPKATLKFPVGEVSLEEKEEEEVKKMLSISGILQHPISYGVFSAQFKDEDLKLRYLYKDEQMSFIPSISLPSNAISFAFKRRFGPSDKLSYWYNLNSNYWSTVYKHTVGKDYKFKAGYDSEVRLGWASLWVGDEGGNAKSAPMKLKVQFMLQVPQDDIHSSALMFRVKKRWDI